MNVDENQCFVERLESDCGTVFQTVFAAQSKNHGLKSRATNTHHLRPSAFIRGSRFYCAKTIGLMTVQLIAFMLVVS